MTFQVTKTFAYDNAISLARFRLSAGACAAAASGTFGYYTALGNEVLWAVGAFAQTAGNGASVVSTNTTLSTGGTYVTTTNTNTVNTTFNAYRVWVSGTNTNTTTSPLVVVAVANSTNGANLNHNWTQMNGTASGAATLLLGGTLLQAGDILYCVKGTDSAGIAQLYYEMSILPQSGAVAA